MILIRHFTSNRAEYSFTREKDGCGVQVYSICLELHTITINIRIVATWPKKTMRKTQYAPVYQREERLEICRHLQLQKIMPAMPCRRAHPQDRVRRRASMIAPCLVVSVTSNWLHRVWADFGPAWDTADSSSNQGSPSCPMKKIENGTTAGGGRLPLFLREPARFGHDQDAPHHKHTKNRWCCCGPGYGGRARPLQTKWACLLSVAAGTGWYTRRFHGYWASTAPSFRSVAREDGSMYCTVSATGEFT